MLLDEVRNSYFINAKQISAKQDEASILAPDNTPDLADNTLDITREVCPMTYVRTRLMLDRMASGQTLLVLLRGDEPAANIPKVAATQGHAVISQQLDDTGLTRLLLKKA